MTDEAQAQDKFDTGAQVGGPIPAAASIPVIGLAEGEHEELLPALYTFLLQGGAIMSFRLFVTAEEFSRYVVEAGVAKVMTLTSLQRDDGSPSQAWAPFYLNLAHVVGFSPVQHVPAAPPPSPPADAAAGPDVV